MAFRARVRRWPAQLLSAGVDRLFFLGYSDLDLHLLWHLDSSFLLNRRARQAHQQSASTELVRAIRAIADGGSYLDPAIAGKVMSGYASRQAGPSTEAAGDLSDREADIPRFIAQGYSNKEIAARLEISVKTVEVHKANTMKKLGLNSRIDIVRFALLKGWLQDT